MAHSFDAEVKAQILARAKTCLSDRLKQREAHHGVGLDSYELGATVWSEQEQGTLLQLMARTEQDASMSHIQRCAMIASELPGKTVRDVMARVCALRDLAPERAGLVSAAMSAAAVHSGLTTPGSLDAEGRYVSEHGNASLHDPSALVAGPGAVRSTMAPNRASSFPHELQVTQLLQENLLIVGKIRTNIMNLMFAENTELMETYRENQETIFTLLGSFSFQLPALTVPMNTTFLPSRDGALPPAPVLRNSRPGAEAANTGALLA